MASKINAYRLVTHRKQANLSQQGAANLLGVTATQLMEWERGKRMPSPKHLFKLEALYQRLISDMYYEQRREAIQEIEANKQKYGQDGLGAPTAQPP